MRWALRYLVDAGAVDPREVMELARKLPSPHPYELGRDGSAVATPLHGMRLYGDALRRWQGDGWVRWLQHHRSCNMKVQGGRVLWSASYWRVTNSHLDVYMYTDTGEVSCGEFMPPDLPVPRRVR